MGDEELDDFAEAFYAFSEIVKKMDTSSWLPMEIRLLEGSDRVGVNKEKTAMYLRSGEWWVRSAELYIDKSYEETFN